MWLVYGIGIARYTNLVARLDRIGAEYVMYSSGVGATDQRGPRSVAYANLAGITTGAGPGAAQKVEELYVADAEFRGPLD